MAGEPGPSASIAPAHRPTVERPGDDCVHCGFCLPTCPTWQSWQEEMDSPRGRIDLWRAVEDGRVAMSPAVASHFDRCLGCMACLTACPSGVRYDHVIERARARVEGEFPRAAADRLHRRLLFALFPYPGRLRVAAVLLWLGQVTGLVRLARVLGLTRLSRRLAALDRLAPRVRLREVVAGLPERVPARGERRLRAGLVAGCVQRVFFPGVNAATLRVLAADGVEVVVPRGQGCCGALSLHAGRIEEARRLARELIEVFERGTLPGPSRGGAPTGYARRGGGLAPASTGAPSPPETQLDVVVVNAAGCGSHLKDLGHLLADDPAWAERARALAAKVRDVSEVLAALGPRARRAPLAARVAYHSACHLGHAQRVLEPPRAMLRAIPGLTLVEIPEGDQCCGSAGVYNLLEAGSADLIGRRKAEAIAATGATLLASPNPGCTLHVARFLEGRGAKIEAAHPIELVDRAILLAEEEDG